MAAAKAVAAWPDGNDVDSGIAISGTTDSSATGDERPLDPPRRREHEQGCQRLPAEVLGGLDREVVELDEKVEHGQEPMVAPAPRRASGSGRERLARRT